MKIQKIIPVVMAIAIALPLSNCARRIGANNYNSAAVGESMRSFEGVVISKRVVDVTDAERLQDNATGGALGGVAGGLAGNQIGRGSGNVAATAGGAILGMFAGAMVEDQLTQQQAYEYTVRVNMSKVRNAVDGNIRTVVQGLDVDIKVGQHVILHEARNGRSRIVPIMG